MFPDTFSFTPEVLAGLLAFIMALVFAYFPKFRVWYAGLVSGWKSLIVIGTLLLITVVSWLLAHYGLIPTVGPVDWWTAAKAFIMTVLVSQPTYVLLPQMKDVRVVIALRDEQLIL